MNAAPEQAKGRTFTTDERRAGQLTQAKARRSPVTNIVAMQQVLMNRVINADPDARDVATCACAWDKLEERRREALGKPRLAPVKTEAKAKGSRRTGLVPPAPRAEPDHDTANNDPGPLSGTVLRQVIVKQTGLPAIESGPAPTTPEQPPTG